MCPGSTCGPINGWQTARPATIIRGVTYGREVDCYFDAETGNLREARWQITLTKQSSERSHDMTITPIRPVVPIWARCPS